MAYVTTKANSLSESCAWNIDVISASNDMLSIMSCLIPQNPKIGNLRDLRTAELEVTLWIIDPSSCQGGTVGKFSSRSVPIFCM